MLSSRLNLSDAANGTIDWRAAAIHTCSEKSLYGVGDRQDHILAALSIAARFRAYLSTRLIVNDNINLDIRAGALRLHAEFSRRRSRQRQHRLRARLAEKSCAARESPK